MALCQAAAATAARTCCSSAPAMNVVVASCTMVCNSKAESLITAKHAVTHTRLAQRPLRRSERRQHAEYKRGVCAFSEPDTQVSTVQRPETSTSDDEVDAFVTFGQLCNEFVCISSPAVERSVRQLARDVLEVKEDKRSMAVIADDIKYQDGFRRFTGKSKYARYTPVKAAFEKPQVVVTSMKLESTNRFTLQWTLKGRPKLAVLPEAVIHFTSTYVVNQISGRVTELSERWDLSKCSPPAAVYFLATRAAFSTTQLGNDASDAVKRLGDKVAGSDSQSPEIFADPTDPRKFFQMEDNAQQDLFQIAFVIASIYLLVQVLRQIL